MFFGWPLLCLLAPAQSHVKRGLTHCQTALACPPPSRSACAFYNFITILFFFSHSPTRTLYTTHYSQHHIAHSNNP